MSMNHLKHNQVKRYENYITAALESLQFTEWEFMKPNNQTSRKPWKNCRPLSRSILSQPL